MIVYPINIYKYDMPVKIKNICQNQIFGKRNSDFWSDLTRFLTGKSKLCGFHGECIKTHKQQDLDSTFCNF